MANTTPTPTPTATPPPPTTLTFAPVADADVNEGSPNTNYGTNILLRLDGGADPDREGYLRFNVSGITGTVQSAKLRLYSPNGTDNGPEVYPVSDTTWGETAIKWSNKPARGATALADVAKVTTNTWVEYSLSPVTVTANGLYSFVLVAQSTDGVDFQSRDNTTNPPQLVLTVGAGTTAGHHAAECAGADAERDGAGGACRRQHPLLQPGRRVHQQRHGRRQHDRCRVGDRPGGLPRRLRR